MLRRECESIRPLISAFFDGDLTPSESMTLHQHLAECEECRQIVDEYQRIRSDFRDLPPSPSPPDHLTNSIWNETVARPRPGGVRRVLRATTTKVGMSTVAALAILAVIVSFLLVRGYNQNLSPAVADSVPVTAKDWPVYQPVKIQFNKPMNHASVEANLQIWPPGERGRIPTSWDGNTLILGSSASRSTPFLPDTTYQVMVLSGAQDAYGHQLGKTWSISFTTSPVSTTAENATPTPVAKAQEVQVTPTSQPAVAVIRSTPTPGALRAPSGDKTGGQPNTTPTPTVASQATPRSTPDAVVAQSTPTPTPVPTRAPTSTPQATATPQPSPTEAPATVVAAAATATPPPATSTAVASPTTSATVAAATATPTPVVIPVTGAFGSVYWGNPDVQSRLGAPTAVEAAMNASELGFQRGTMYERFDQNIIYVFMSNGEWVREPNTWTPSDGEGGGAGPQAGLWIPKEAFWKIWSNDQTLADTIGFAVEQDAHLMDTNGGSFQNFANGIMLYSDQGFVYVVYNDGKWTLYPDTSGHGVLITPTPQPASSPTATPAGSTPAPATTSTPVSSAATPVSSTNTTTSGTP